MMHIDMHQNEMKIDELDKLHKHHHQVNNYQVYIIDN